MGEGIGAKDEVRTRDLNLGKVALYQLSYFRILLKEHFPLRECKYIQKCVFYK
jgi:hypothetical protein